MPKSTSPSIRAMYAIANKEMTFMKRGCAVIKNVFFRIRDSIFIGCIHRDESPIVGSIIAGRVNGHKLVGRGRYVRPSGIDPELVMIPADDIVQSIAGDIHDIAA